MQGLGLCTDMLHWTPGYAASGIIALISPLYVCVLPIMAPVRPIPHAMYLLKSFILFFRARGQTRASLC